MKLLARRSPPGWALLIAASVFAVLAFYGLATGEAYMPGGRGSTSQHVFQSKEPDRFFRIVHSQLGFTALLVALSLIRVVPVEDFFRGMQRSLNAKVRHDRTPAPTWAYAFLVGFIGLVVWIGWMVMYSQ